MVWLLLFLSFGAMWLVSVELEKGCAGAAHRLRLPPSVAGATLLAISSSAPEFFTSLLGTVRHGVFEIGLMAILWSAIFNLTVLPGASALATPHEKRGKGTIFHKVVWRDALSYLVIALLLFFLVSDGNLSALDSVILLGAYGAYILLLKDSQGGESVLPSQYAPWRIALSLILGIALIALLTEVMIGAGTQIAAGISGLSLPLVSALLFAAGTSVPDTFLSVISARKGNISGSISNAFGSNSFDLTVCLAVPALAVGGVEVPFTPMVSVSFSMLLGTLLVALILVRTGYEISKKEGVFLLFLYPALLWGLLYLTPT